ncbi:hypothetical protein NXS19_002195 [Fusarium pseudograminearum]|nr:hypothetical protein NXS19_002195 [Fusarium pseudograminearum]
MTSTLYTTKYFTVTACPPQVTDCPIGQVTSSVYATATTQIQQWHPSNSGVYQPPAPTNNVPPTVPTTYIGNHGNQTTTFYRSTTKLYETPVHTPKPIETTQTAETLHTTTASVKPSAPYYAPPPY